MAASSSSSSAQKRINQLKEEQALLENGSEAWKKIDATIEKIEKRLTNSLSNMEDFSDSVSSLGQFIGKNNKLFETMNILADDMSSSMDSISQAMKHDLLNGASKFKKEVFKTADAYKNFGNTVATSTKKLIKQQITTSQYNQSVLDGYEDLEEQIDRVEASIESLTGQSKQFAKETLSQLKNAKERTEAFAAAAEKSKKNLEGMGFAIDTVASNGIPAMNELGGVIKSAAEGGMGLTLAFAALGAALGKVAYDTGLFGDKLKTIAGYDKKIAGLKGQIDAINQQVNLGIFGGRNFVKESAILDFSNTVTQMGIEFETASRTALFGKSLGGVGYGAAQLQMAGISAETIATAMKDASSTMGSNVGGKFGADMAILAARTGQTSEGIASISDTFMRLGGVSKETAINMQEGLRTMADQANINLGSLMEDVAEASKDALSYQLKSPAALAKAATFAQTLGTKFTDIANAGRSMVLNYKDSIKAEMSLSAMLGKRVDLSQVRALFAAGKTEEAIKALKAQGLDPSKMNMFQQEALKNATGGMDLNTLQKIATRTGRSGGELEAEKVKIGNDTFLLSKQAGESAKAIGSAVASAMTAVQKTLLESKAEQQRQEAIENNTQGLKDLMNSLTKTELMKSIVTGISAAVPMLIGALVMGFAGPKMIGKAMTNALKNAGIAGAGAGTGGIGAGASITNGLKFNSVGKVINAQTGRYVASGTANAFKASQSLVQPAGTFTKPGMGSSFTSTMANTAKTSVGSKVASNLASSVKGVSGVLSVLTAAYDYKTRKEQGQSTLQAASGAGGGATGALAGAALGSAIVPVIGTIIGGAIGYWAGSSLADELTGANEPTVAAQETIQEELNQSQIAQSIKDGQLLSDSAYTIELQKEMVAQLGLSTTLLYEIADYNARGLFQSVNIDGKKVMDALASTSRKQFGVARNTMSSTTVR